MAVPILGVPVAALYCDREDGVTAGGVLVHKGGSSAPVLLPHCKHVAELRHTLDNVVRQVLNVHARVRALFHLELVIRVLRKQIANVLVVNLQEGRTHQILLIGTPLNIGEDCLEAVRNNATQLWIVWNAFHRVRLPRPRLPIREYRSVVTLQTAAHDGLGTLVENIKLLAVPVIHHVKGESPRGLRARGLWVAHGYPALLNPHVHNTPSALIDLLPKERPTTNHDLHTLRGLGSLRAGHHFPHGFKLGRGHVDAGGESNDTEAISRADCERLYKPGDGARRFTGS
mmetsp:Transcript_29764/g.65008  ORF Transcript_29764/g.65008 Transcript_29764/m.65008 type:complete len:286 (-) Transcript_29764:37-894(-)